MRIKLAGVLFFYLNIYKKLLIRFSIFSHIFLCCNFFFCRIPFYFYDFLPKFTFHILCNFSRNIYIFIFINLMFIRHSQQQHHRTRENYNTKYKKTTRRPCPGLLLLCYFCQLLNLYTLAFSIFSFFSNE